MASTKPYIELKQIVDRDELTGHARGLRHELAQLVEECESRLHVDLAAIIMRDKRLRDYCDNYKQLSNHADTLVKELDRDLHYWLKTARKVVMRNSQATIKNRRTHPSVRCKIVLAPVSLTKNSVDGIFVIANPPSAPDFTGREKDLLKSLATTASNIIRAHYDIDTGLVTRKEFEFILESALFSEGTMTPKSHCVLYLDLDELQTFEDFRGRQARDEVVRQVALQLDQQSKETGPVGRIGEDEFTILLKNCPLDRGRCIGQEICRAINSLNIVWSDEAAQVTASIGVAQLIPGVGTPESVLAAARIACVTAKERGRNQVAAFRHDDAVRLNGQRRVEIVSRIQKALQNDRFLLYSQVIRSLSTRKRGQHFEILLRGIDDNDKLIEPNEFMPYAEQSNIMPEIDRWVVKHSLDALSECQTFMKRPSIVFSINLSGQSFCADGFLDFVIGEFKRTNVPPTSICFEVTETAAILNLTRATQFMSTLRKHGCLFSLDDFGAGLSSFSYLRTLPVDYLKIDGQFVREIADDPVCSSIVTAINQMSHAVGLKTIAEFVETSAIKKHLINIGVDYAQGYSIEKPRPLSDALGSLASRTKSARQTHQRDNRRGA